MLCSSLKWMKKLLRHVHSAAVVLGGETKEYQVRLDPDKLVSYGLSISQVEQQLANNNTNAGGSYIVAGAQQINVQAVGLVATVQDIENTVIKTQAGTALPASSA